MKFTQTLPLRAPLETLAAVDPVAVMRCIPGLEAAEPRGPDTFAVRAVTGVGPIRLTLTGTATLRAREPDRVAADVSLRDPVAGGIHGTFGLRAGSDGLVVEADIAISGRLGEFAQPILRRKAEQAVREFGENLARWLAEQG